MRAVRPVVVLLTVGIVVAPLAAGARVASRLPRIGVTVGSVDSPETVVTLEAFRHGLGDHGLVENRTS